MERQLRGLQHRSLAQPPRTEPGPEDERDELSPVPGTDLGHRPHHLRLDGTGQVAWLEQAGIDLVRSHGRIVDRKGKGTSDWPGSGFVQVVDFHREKDTLLRTAAKTGVGAAEVLLGQFVDVLAGAIRRGRHDAAAQGPGP